MTKPGALVRRPLWLVLAVCVALAAGYQIGRRTPRGTNAPDTSSTQPDEHSGDTRAAGPRDGKRILPGPERLSSGTGLLPVDHTKAEYRIPMRDGAHLFTAVYAPKDASEAYPFLIRRTPYCLDAYGEDTHSSLLFDNAHLVRSGYIFVEQDVRGCCMSEGEFTDMTPHIDDKTRDSDVDESTDTYDTIEWLLENIPNHNGRVGLRGMSYPGFYAAAGMIDAHPAIQAVSPQAPTTDWFFDDDHHHGAFFLAAAFDFCAFFDGRRTAMAKQQPLPGPYDYGTSDSYHFFMDLGPLENVEERYFKGNIPLWSDLVEHPNYDDFWQVRNILPHLRNVAPAVMTVGGWFDAEDLYGALNLYRSIEEQNPGISNVLVMGPWAHGSWLDPGGDRLGCIEFGSQTADFFRNNIELPFFNHFLKGSPSRALPEAYVFETGSNRWREFGSWPPPGVELRDMFLHSGGRIRFEAPDAEGLQHHDEYLSDPARPVPYTNAITAEVPVTHMVEDQRFAARRPDVLVYQTEPLAESMTLAGPITANLWVSTSGTASDWIVKLIDVFPENVLGAPETTTCDHMDGYQMLVRWEVIRGRFRNSYEHPEPITPGQPTKVTLPLQDVLHTFKKNHRIMVQIQSTCFPLVDRNPQKYVDNIFLADEQDFIKAIQRVYRSREYPTHLRIGVLTSHDP